MMATVDLGFVEEVEDPRRVETHHYFIDGKVGGRPVWLAMDPLPSGERHLCKICWKPMCFLVQIYAPLELNADCFHRSLFVFICRDPDCCQPNSAKNLGVFRCQLPRENRFYGYQPLEPDFEGELKKVEEFSSVCAACGCYGGKKCGKCGVATYCSKEHQAIHWRNGHKQRCGTGEVDKCTEILFPEWELVMDKEEWEEAAKGPERSEEARMRELQKYLEKNPTPKLNDKDVSDMEKAESDARLDKIFTKFKERIQAYPDQVIRYNRGGTPLWASGSVPESVVDCELCGGERLFEFQLMPRLLSFLDVDELGKSIDWATVSIFTCANSCPIPDCGYADEFVWKQDFND